MTSSRLPNFLVIGAMKTGTTSLYAYLRTHPEIFMPSPKELDYFVAERNWVRGFSWYRRQFADAPAGTRASGEASTNYTKSPTFQGVPERIKYALPDVKLIYVIRDPVARLRSHVGHRAWETGERMKLADAATDPHMRACGNYAYQISQYLQCFHPSRILVLVSERMRTQRAAMLSEVFAFLHVAQDFVPPNLHQEFGQSRLPDEPLRLTTLEAIRLRRELAVEVQQLKPFLPDDFDGWGLLS